MSVEFKRRLFTVDEYHRMAEAGILTADDRVELLDGEIVEMTPIGPSHAGCGNLLARLLIERVGRRAVVGIQTPVTLDDRSEPQPDLWVARPSEDHYKRAHPGPDDLRSVIEVADTSLLWDRNRKIPRYAAAGIPEVVLVDLAAGRIECFRGPGPDGYGEHRVFEPGGWVELEAFPDVVLSVDEILGPPAGG